MCEITNIIDTVAGWFFIGVMFVGIYYMMKTMYEMKG